MTFKNYFAVQILDYIKLNKADEIVRLQSEIETLKLISV